jgi:hypothetical protein
MKIRRLQRHGANNMMQVKNDAEFRKWTKPIRDQKLQDELGDDGFKLLEKALKENEKLRKKLTAVETRLDNITARLITLEMKDDG